MTTHSSSQRSRRARRAPVSRASLLFPLVAGAALGLGACSLAPRDGPSKSAILQADPQTRDYDLVELSADNIGPYALQRPRYVRRPTPSGVSQLAVQPGDVLRIAVSNPGPDDLFASMAIGGTVFPAVRVENDGRISLPYIDSMRASGKTTGQIAREIRAQLAGHSTDPQVYVELTAHDRHSILVSGEVHTPGRIPTVDGPLNVVAAVARAGGPLLPDYQVDVDVSRAEGVISLPYSDVLAGQDFTLHDGDEVILHSDIRRFVAMGAVGKPGLQDMNARRMSLLDGMAQVGGLRDAAAAPSGVFLFRFPDAAPGSTGRPLVFHLDMSQPQAFFLARRLELRADDALYVTNAPIYDLQKFIVPIVQAAIIGRLGADF